MRKKILLDSIIEDQKKTFFDVLQVYGKEFIPKHQDIMGLIPYKLPFVNWNSTFLLNLEKDYNSHPNKYNVSNKRILEILENDLLMLLRRNSRDKYDSMIGAREQQLTQINKITPSQTDNKEKIIDATLKGCSTEIAIYEEENTLKYEILKPLPTNILKISLFGLNKAEEIDTIKELLNPLYSPEEYTIGFYTKATKKAPQNQKVKSKGVERKL